MKLTYYVPIYKWGDDPNTVNGTRTGSTMYTDLRDLYGFENQNGEVVGYYEVSGVIPSKEEFEAAQK